MDSEMPMPDPLDAWPAGFAPLTCVGVRDETPTTKTFVFEAGDPAFSRFEAGQALVLSIPLGEERLTRTFSIASAPGSALELTIKAHPMGRATRWLHERMSAGGVLGARTPRGRFTLAAARTRKLAFVSAGSGATPLMSMLRALDRSGETLDVAWHHGATTADEVLFARDLADLQSRHPGLCVTISLSRAGPGWFGYRGRLSRRRLSTAVPDIGSRDVFCCGPAGFMTEAKLIHAAEGGTPDRFHWEAFGAIPTEAIAPASLQPATSGAGHSLKVGDRLIEVGPDETILQACLHKGIVIPCGCAQGLCGTCMVRGVEGDFRMSHQGGISPEEEEAGYVLACSTRLAGPAEIAF